MSASPIAEKQPISISPDCDFIKSVSLSICKVAGVVVCSLIPELVVFIFRLLIYGCPSFIEVRISTSIKAVFIFRYHIFHGCLLRKGNARERFKAVILNFN